MLVDLTALSLDIKTRLFTFFITEALAIAKVLKILFLHQNKYFLQLTEHVYISGMIYCVYFSVSNIISNGLIESQLIRKQFFDFIINN